MSDVVKVDASQVLELQKRLQRWVKIAPQEVAKVLTKGGEKVRREVQAMHLSGPKMMRGIGHPTDATLAVQTGRLRGSIALRVLTDPNAGKFYAQVGTNVAYGRKHEFGLQGMPERPFLRPSLEKKRPEVFKMIQEEFMKSYGK